MELKEKPPDLQALFKKPTPAVLYIIIHQGAEAHLGQTLQVADIHQSVAVNYLSYPSHFHLNTL